MVHAETQEQGPNLTGSTVLSTVAARNQFADVINRVAYGKERIVLARRGKELVAIIPVEEFRDIEAWEDARDVELAQQAMAEDAGKPTMSWEDFEAELERERAG